MSIKKLIIGIVLLPALLSADMITRGFNDKQVADKRNKVIDSYISIDSIRPYGKGPKVTIYARRWPDSVATIMYGTDTSKTKFTTIPSLLKDSVEILAPDSVSSVYKPVWWNKRERLENAPIESMKFKVSGDSLIRR